MKVVGAEEVLTECSDSVNLDELQKSLKEKLKTEIFVKVENNEVVVNRLLVD